MAAVNHMITIPAEQEQFLVDNPEISLSKIVQRGLAEMQENMKISAATLKEANRKRQVWQDLAQKRGEFIEKKGLSDDYNAEYV